MFSSNTQPPSFKIVNSDHQTSCCIFLLERFVSLAKVIRKKLNVTLISLPPIHICIMCMRTCTLTQCIYTCIYIYTYRFEDLCRTVCTKCVDINISIYSVYIFYIYMACISVLAITTSLGPFTHAFSPRLAHALAFLGPG